MSVFDEIKAERDHIRAELERLRAELLRAGQAEVEEKGEMPTKVAVLTAGANDVRYLYPTWEEGGASEAFAMVNDYIKEENADGAVVAYDGVYEPKDEDEQMTAALILMTHMLGHSEMLHVPFTEQPDGRIEWGEPQTEPLRSSSFITAFGGN